MIINNDIILIYTMHLIKADFAYFSKLIPSNLITHNTNSYFEEAS